MRRFFLLLAAVWTLLSCAMAQDKPRGEVFFGYSYERIHIVRAQGANSSGFNVAGEVNLNNWAGIVADVSGNYVTTSGTDFNQYHFLFGPQFTYRSSSSRLMPFGRVLLGGTHGGGNTATTLNRNESVFTWAVGGGVDVRLTDHWSARVIQADFIQTRFNDTRNNNGRLSFGIVARF